MPRRRTLRIAAAGLTAVAALTLTACGNEDDADALQTRPARPVTPPSEDGRRPAATNGVDEGERAAPARRAACDATTIRIVAQPLTRPVNHLLLQATNTTGAPCSLYAAPYLRCDDAQSPLAGLADNRHRAVVTLAPGTSGYAAVRTSSAYDGGHHGRTVASLSVRLAGRDGKGGSGGAAKVALPGGSLYLDDSAWVTYWQASPSDAVAW